MLTPDGCPVEVYAALPAEPDLSTVRSLIRASDSVLDLGAGAGRIADALAVAGHTVLAVDESAQMLACIRHAATAQARIEQFSTDQRFDAVLLLSQLINAPVRSQRRALLATATRHLAPGGLVVVQRLDPSHAIGPGRATVGEVLVMLRDVDAARWPLISAVTRYHVGEQSWDQPWLAEVLDDAATSQALQSAGLRPRHMSGAWVLADLDDGSDTRDVMIGPGHGAST